MTSAIPLQKPAYMRWLPSKTTATIASMEFISRGVMQGFIAGRHKSPHKGFSIEFAEHRQYTPGDDLRNLDWHVLARSDRSYIKQYVEETNLRATILVDTSGSMKYRGDAAAAVENAPCSKLEYAQYLAAILSYLFIGQQYAVGLVTFDTAIRTYIPARARASQVRACFEALDARSPAARRHRGHLPRHRRTHPAPRPRHHHQRPLRRSRADRQRPPPLSPPAARGRRPARPGGRGADVPLRPVHPLPEPGGRRGHPNGSEGPRKLLEQIRLFLQAIKNGCGRIGADYVAMNTATPFDQALSAYLTRRRTGQG